MKICGCHLKSLSFIFPHYIGSLNMSVYLILFPSLVMFVVYSFVIVWVYYFDKTNDYSCSDNKNIGLAYLQPFYSQRQFSICILCWTCICLFVWFIQQHWLSCMIIDCLGTSAKKYAKRWGVCCKYCFTVAGWLWMWRTFQFKSRSDINFASCVWQTLHGRGRAGWFFSTRNRL